jgi:hypothetical protein
MRVVLRDVNQRFAHRKARQRWEFDSWRYRVIAAAGQCGGPFKTGYESVVHIRPGAQRDGRPAMRCGRGHRFGDTVASAAEPVLPVGHVRHDLRNRVNGARESTLRVGRLELLESVSGRNVSVGLNQQTASIHPETVARGTPPRGPTGPALSTRADERIGRTTGDRWLADPKRSCAVGQRRRIVGRALMAASSAAWQR